MSLSFIRSVETIDGTAEFGQDYQKIDEIKTMLPNQRYLPIDVIIVDDNQWEPDETFFVKISPHNNDPGLKLGPKAICMITIINDDEPGEVEFKEPVHVVKESVGTFDILVERKNGADGDVSIKYKTTEINAIAGKDFETAEGVLQFKHAEVKKTIQIKIIDGRINYQKKNLGSFRDVNSGFQNKNRVFILHRRVIIFNKYLIL